MFMAFAISRVTAVPPFIASPTVLMLPSSWSSPIDICSRNRTASSEPNAFLSLTCAAAFERSGKPRFSSWRIGTMPLSCPRASTNDSPSS